MQAAAGAGRAHLPEIVRGRDADDPVLGDTDLLPDLEGFIVGVVDVVSNRLASMPKSFVISSQAKGIASALEIIAEAEIPQHLEERVMPRGVAHVVEVIVLAACAHTFLAGRGARVIAVFDAERNRFLNCTIPELVNNERRVVARHQRRRMRRPRDRCGGNSRGRSSGYR